MSDEASTARPLVVAHRGASRAYAENTLAAFRGAATLRSDWVELDARRTADDVLIVHHDAHLPDDGPAIVTLPAADLPASIPTLADALAACKRPGADHPGLGVNVEIKSDPDDPDFDAEYRLVEPVLALIHEVLDPVPVLVTSFDPRCVARVRALDPTVPTGQLAFQLDDPTRVIERAAAAGHVALNPWDPYVTADLVASAHAAGLAVNVWTVDDPARMAELVDFGVDGIITNVPDVARAVVDGTPVPDPPAGG